MKLVCCTVTAAVEVQIVMWCRLEAEMAALDLDDLLQQRAAAESQAQAEAARNADLQEELLQVGWLSYALNFKQHLLHGGTCSRGASL